MAVVFNLRHESNDFSEYDSTPGTGFSTKTAAALGSGTYGVEIDFDVSPPVTLPVHSFGSTFSVASDDARFGFRYDLNNVAMNNNGDSIILMVIDDGLGFSFLQVEIVRTAAGVFRMDCITHQDVGSSTITAAAIPTGGDTFVEIVWTRPSSSVASDGTFTLYINNVQKDQLTNLDNYDDWLKLDDPSMDFQIDHNEVNGTGTVSGQFYIDEITLRDDTVPIFQNYSYIQSSGGLAKSALAVSQDGDNVFIALEDSASGNQIIFKATRPSSPTVSAVYEPGAGSAANVIPTGDPDKMVFFGNFGSNIGLLFHTISTGAESDKSPSTIGADKIQPVAIDPSDINHLVAINQADQDVLETEDGGTSWSMLNAALGQTPAALSIMFFGALFPFGAFIGGNDGVDENLTYTPNEFANLREDSGASLPSVGSITGIDLVVS